MYGLTIGESKSLTLKYLDEYSAGGEILSKEDNFDYLSRHNAFADSVQMSLGQLFPLSRVYAINQHSLNTLISAGGFGLNSCLPGEDFILNGEGAGAYFFEISGKASIRIEEKQGFQWQILEEINHEGRGFKACRGNIKLKIYNNPVRLVFYSAFPFQIKNAVLYGCSFSEPEDIPQYRPWLRYKMPEDFLRLDKIVIENKQDYGAEALFYWENERTLVLPHDLTAQISVYYWAYPPKIDENTPDDYIYPLAPELARLIPLKVAALIISAEKPELARRLFYLYEQELLGIKNEHGQDFKAIESVFKM